MISRYEETQKAIKALQNIRRDQAQRGYPLNAERKMAEKIVFDLLDRLTGSSGAGAVRAAFYDIDM